MADKRTVVVQRHSQRSGHALNTRVRKTGLGPRYQRFAPRQAVATESRAAEHPSLFPLFHFQRTQLMELRVCGPF